MRRPLHGALLKWHQAYERAAQEIWDSWDQRKKRELAATLLRPGLDVRLTHRCTHFDHSFGLNRLVTQLLARLHAHHRKRELHEVLLAGWQLCRVESLDEHRCGDPHNCHGRPHRAHALPSQCPTRPGDNTGAEAEQDAELGEYDAVLVRHGVVPNRVLGEPVIGEHLVPYHVPV